MASKERPRSSPDSSSVTWPGSRIAATGLAALAKTAATAFVGSSGSVLPIYCISRGSCGARRQNESRLPETDGGEHGWRAFLASLTLTLANPKTILFFLALLPTVIDLASMNLTRFVEISAAMCVVLPAVLGAYVFLAARARELFTTPKAVRRLNRGSGVAMAGAAIVGRDALGTRRLLRLEQSTLRQPRGNTEPRCARWPR